MPWEGSSCLLPARPLTKEPFRAFRRWRSELAPGPPRPDGAQRPRASPIDIRKDAQPAGSRKLFLLTGIGRRGPGGKPALTTDPRKKAQSLGFMAKAMGRNFFFLIIQWLHFKSHVRTNRGGNYKAACLFVSVRPQSRSCLSSGEVVGGGIKLRLPNSLSLCIYLSVCLLVFFPITSRQSSNCTSCHSGPDLLQPGT